MGGYQAFGLGFGRRVDRLGHAVELVPEGVMPTGALALGAKQGMVATARESRGPTIAADGGVGRSTATEPETHGCDVLFGLKFLRLVRMYCPQPLVTGVLIREIRQTMQIAPPLLGPTLVDKPLGGTFIGEPCQVALQAQGAELRSAKRMLCILGTYCANEASTQRGWGALRLIGVGGWLHTVAPTAPARSSEFRSILNELPNISVNAAWEFTSPTVASSSSAGIVRLHAQ